ncbi:MAG: hypothetical protein AAGI70_08040 [Pseudomonadota bacterium]
MTHPDPSNPRRGALFPFAAPGLGPDLACLKPAGAAVDVALLAWGRITNERRRRP